MNKELYKKARRAARQYFKTFCRPVEHAQRAVRTCDEAKFITAWAIGYRAGKRAEAKETAIVLPAVVSFLTMSLEELQHHVDRGTVVLPDGRTKAKPEDLHR